MKRQKHIIQRVRSHSKKPHKTDHADVSNSEKDLQILQRKLRKLLKKCVTVTQRLSPKTIKT